MYEWYGTSADRDDVDAMERGDLEGMWDDVLDGNGAQAFGCGIENLYRCHICGLVGGH